LELNMGF